MSSPLVRVGRFSFRYRGYLLPIAILLLLLPSPRLSFDPALPGWLGLLTAFIGQAIRIGTIGLAYIIRGGKDHRVYAEDLVTGGLYGHCRNPMYVGNFFLALGLGIASNSWLFLIGGMAITLAMHRAIVAAEEDFLQQKFDAQYQQYCARVPRWIPQLSGLARTIRQMHFNWQRVLVKEYASVFDWLSATALLVLSNLGRHALLDEHVILSTLALAIIIGRLILSQLSKRAARAHAVAHG